MLADPRDLDHAAEILNAGKRAAILAGRAALNATAGLEQAAEILSAPIGQPCLSRFCFRRPVDLPA
jgi:thiamine pyrophosphate-dependent acetolactate synthase large subunit-like protein